MVFHPTHPSLKKEFEHFKSFNEKSIVRLIRLLHRHLTSSISDKLIEAGHTELSARHITIFEFIDYEGTNIVTLAARAGITKQAMSKLVKEVANEGYIETISDKYDNRSLIVYLTPKGYELLRDIINYTNICKSIAGNDFNISLDESITTFKTLNKLLAFYQQANKN